ncbi:hypothetical protein [Streptomyces sp. NPDC008092]|uniref:hypothetical protein n=1 Tax=Streptomyces sp. NPDC008092 TaxID=3364808 RepID=UPI0036EB0D16
MTAEPVSGAVPCDDQGWVESVDGVLAARARSSAEYLAGLLAAAEVETAGGARKLPADSWPDVDPGVVQEIWDRACATAWSASRFASSPWLYRDRLQGLQAALSEAGFHAMAGTVGRSRGLVARAGHPADSEIAREH